MLEAPFRMDLAHGHCVGVAIASVLPDEALAALLPAERAFARGLGPARRAGWVAGRTALRGALTHLGIDAGPLLATPRGAPMLPAGVVGSISHKRDLAVALVAPRSTGDPSQIGVDLEVDAPLRADITRRVLTEAELARLTTLPQADRQRSLLLLVSAKEALYKALDPCVQRYVGFKEVSVEPLPGGTARVELLLSGGEGPFTASVHWRAEGAYILTSARIGPFV